MYKIGTFLKSSELPSPNLFWDTATYNVVSDDNERWIFMQLSRQFASRSPPKNFHPVDYHRSLSQSAEKVIFSEQQILDSKLYAKKNDLEREFPASFKVTLGHKYIPSINQEPDDDIFSSLQSAFLPFPLSLILWLPTSAIVFFIVVSVLYCSSCLRHPL